MKYNRHLSGITLIQILTVLALPLKAENPAADSQTSQPVEVATGGDVSEADIASRQEPVDEEALDAAITEVQERVEMSAPMELEIEAGVDPVIEAVELGLIVDVSLEEVEAALAAAAATPEIEDDQRAMLLKHRGSYRFFCGESDGEIPLPEAPPAETPATETASPEEN